MEDRLSSIILKFLQIQLEGTEFIQDQWDKYYMWLNSERPVMILKVDGTLWVDNDILIATSTMLNQDFPEIEGIFGGAIKKGWDLDVTSIKIIG